MKQITSKDSRKKDIMKLFKESTGATRISCVTEHLDFYQAHCQKYVKASGMYESLGFYKLEKIDFKNSNFNNVIFVKKLE